MSVADRARTPFWFVWWMTLLIGLTVLLCLGLGWVLVSQGSDTTRAVLLACLGVVGVLAALFGLLGLFRYRAVRLTLTAPLLIGALAVLVWYDVPERAGWAVSRGILEDQSVDCVNPGHRTRLGVYSIRYVDRKDGGCLFYFEGDEKNSEGLGYFPDTPPPYIGAPADRGVAYEPYHIPWYRFVDNS
ncbi:hypothetical protein [Nocardia bovistercoris]|uniref:Uncharacterized protein n=1 Tax=Nocardia bovistercoris TaxID=2785916 RepID=A0A931N381_9NOCA|nr:hypothetical protein [Nocardia bovistercoris]MBH0776288.1 hypothetical protein [Nocardia bovistercoris]